MLKVAFGLAAASASALLLANPTPDPEGTPAEPTLQQVRAATERFQDVKVALAEGYVRDPTYEPQADGSLQLVAVENLVFQKSWHAAGNTKPPSFHGVEWDTMQDDPATEIDEAHMFEPHYDRHVWLYRDNPKGMFAQFNPNVSCKAHKQTHQMAGMKM
jgi:hypothetical protein